MFKKVNESLFIIIVLIIFLLLEEKKDTGEQDTNDDYYLHPSLLQTSVGFLFDICINVSRCIL